jgi:predicted kinase
MLYLVGGVARAGKSQVATTMNNKYQIPWLSLDTLRWGLGKGAPSLQIDSNNDDQKDAARIWPIVEAMSDNILFDGRSYLIEGGIVMSRATGEPLITAQQVMLLRSYVKLLCSPNIQ